jgi:hypothetical protein
MLIRVIFYYACKDQLANIVLNVFRSIKTSY